MYYKCTGQTNFFINKFLSRSCAITWFSWCFSVCFFSNQGKEYRNYMMLYFVDVAIVVFSLFLSLTQALTLTNNYQKK